jgi:hypothetical protein
VTPYAATLVVTSAADDSVVARVSPVRRRLSVDVPPGDYAINPAGNGFPFGQPVATVEAGVHGDRSR